MICAYIAYNDLSGRWEPYRLNESKKRILADSSINPWRKQPMRKYIDPLLYVFRDLLCTLSIATFFWVRHVPGLYESLTRLPSEVNWLKDFFSAICAYILSKSYGTIIHYIFHKPPFYKIFHKFHHYPLWQMSPTAAWKEKFLEFLIIEFLGSYVLGTYFF